MEDSLKKIAYELRPPIGYDHNDPHETHDWDLAERLDALRAKMLAYEDAVTLQDDSQGVRDEWEEFVREVAGE